MSDARRAACDARWAPVGNSWRPGGDDVSWPGILSNIDIASQLAQYAFPGAFEQPQRAVVVCATAVHDCCEGAFNDTDYLLFQDASLKYAQTAEQSRIQFSVYAMLSATFHQSRPGPHASPPLRYANAAEPGGHCC